MMTDDQQHPPEAAIALDGLTKRYGDRVAVDRLDLVVPAGTTAGLIGPNGAGKTTAMAMLLGLVRPSSGSGTVLGQPLDDPARYLPRVGAMIEAPAFYPGLTGHENLRLLAIAGGHDPGEAPALAERVGLAGRGDDRYRSYSLGMKQRLGIAAALLGDPDLLVLDEPTNGLDPSGIHEVRRLIGSLAAGHRTVLVSSHALGEVQAICDWLVVIDRGRRMFAGPVEDFVAGDDAAVAVVAVPEHAADVGRLLAALAARGIAAEPAGGVTGGGGTGGTAGPHDSPALVVRAAGTDARATAVAVNRAAAELGCTLVELRTETADLESRFLALVNGADR
jgi:ABC-2 type transport system ATP-binding protein